MPLSKEGQMAEIRAVRPSDLDDLYRICLATGTGGEDASTLYRDPRLLGHVYAAPYAVLSPQSVFVVEDTKGVGGYIVGAPDTRDFETRLEAEWWPGLRSLCNDPAGEERAGWSQDQLISYKIHHPGRTANEIVEPYPSHLHINLLPHLRGGGIGRQLMERWLATVREMGSRGAHLAVGAANRRAIRFYRACGFHQLERPSKPAPAPVWFGIDLSGGVGEVARAARRNDAG
jgi:ribosomal protein S18 acetylase RimI-like enzyme